MLLLFTRKDLELVFQLHVEHPLGLSTRGVCGVISGCVSALLVLRLLNNLRVDVNLQWSLAKPFHQA